MRALLLVVAFAGCGGVISMGAQASGAGGSGGGGGGGPGGTPTDIPCEVTALVVSQCAGCHGDPLAGGAPVTLLTQAQFAAPSMVDSTQSYAQRSLVRMQAGSMPPGGGVSTVMLDAFSAWVAGGLTGSCNQPVDTTLVQTCASNLFQSTPSEVTASEHMAPGYACISCHTGQNFASQNPNRLSAPNEPGDTKTFQFMGTVFPAVHEMDLCADRPSTPATVEIYDMNGTKVLTMQVNSVGNFMGDVVTGMPTPYTAKVVTSAGSRAMVGGQTSGDCNACHTALGEQGAPGRIFLP